MPPRLPHGLKKGPFHMNTSEKTVLGLLGCSIVGGFYTLATSPLYDKDTNADAGAEMRSSKDNKDNKNSLSFNDDDEFYADTSTITGDKDKDKSKSRAYLFKL